MLVYRIFYILCLLSGSVAIPILEPGGLRLIEAGWSYSCYKAPNWTLMFRDQGFSVVSSSAVGSGSRPPKSMQLTARSVARCQVQVQVNTDGWMSCSSGKIRLPHQGPNSQDCLKAVLTTHQLPA